MAIISNDPSLWRDKLPVHDPCGHKYGRGVAVVYGAPKMTGATRLAARACARMGAGLVRVIAPEGTGEIYRSTLHEEIIVEDEADFKGFSDPRVTAFLAGPGWSEKDAAQYWDIVEAAISPPSNPPARGGKISGEQNVPPQEAGMRGERRVVLDAGAFLNMRSLPWPLQNCVVTPHEGEFAKIFPDFSGDKVEMALKAAALTGATIVLKGAQTVIAGQGDVIVQDRAVPELATAGTGDILAGMIAGMIAQGVEVKWGCAAAVWIHAEAAARFGRGMVASDLPEMIPAILRDL